MLPFVLFALELSTASPERHLLDLSNTTQRSDDYPFMLGRGYDLSTANLWDFSSGLVSKQILDMQDLPASCARQDDSCVHITTTQIDKFTSVTEAFSTFQESAHLSFGLKVWDIAASLNAAWGNSGGSSWFSESYGSLGLKMEVKRCHTLETGCLKANHGDIKALKRFTDSILTNDTYADVQGCSIEAMDYWRTTVIKQFGTHMATQTRNGAMMRYQEFANYDGHDAGQCMFDSVCAGMRFAGFQDVTVKFGMCSNSSSCEGVSSYHTSVKSKCVAVGGKDMSGLPAIEVPDGPTFKLEVSHTEGKASNCHNVNCFDSWGLDDCRDKCAGNAECNVFNFCPEGASCTSGKNRCCMRTCEDKNLKLSSKWKGWDVYSKQDGCEAQYEEMNGVTVKLTTITGTSDVEKDHACCAECSRNPECEFWVRSTSDDDCWLKKDYTGSSSDSSKRGNHRTTAVKSEAQTMCNSFTTAATRAQFFEPSNEELNSDLTVVGMDFMPIEDLALAYGASYTNTQTILKAREYHMCKALPSHVWQWSTEDCGSDNGEGKCKCIRKCENGGTLDEATCTCKCRGNEFHGWKGETCTEEYGSCQPGAGTGNPKSAKKCAADNHCASWYHGYNCKATEVCCLTDFYGKCCPYGSSCSCGVNNCKCITPTESFINLIAPAPPSPGTYTKKPNVSCRKDKIKINKDGFQKSYKTFNFAKAKQTCDALEECVGVMDSGCDGVGKYTLCKKSDRGFKEKPGYCIHVKEN